MRTWWIRIQPRVPATVLLLSIILFTVISWAWFAKFLVLAGQTIGHSGSKAIQE